MKILMLLIAFLGGTGLSVIGYFAAVKMLKKNDKMYPALSIVRQLAGIIYLTTLFLVCRASENLNYLLIGGALGVTIPSILLSLKLAKTVTPSEKDEEQKNG